MISFSDGLLIEFCFEINRQQPGMQPHSPQAMPQHQRGGGGGRSGGGSGSGGGHRRGNDSGGRGGRRYNPY